MPRPARRLAAVRAAGQFLWRWWGSRGSRLCAAGGGRGGLPTHPDRLCATVGASGCLPLSGAPHPHTPRNKANSLGPKRLRRARRGTTIPMRRSQAIRPSGGIVKGAQREGQSTGCPTRSPFRRKGIDCRSKGTVFTSSATRSQVMAPGRRRLRRNSSRSARRAAHAHGELRGHRARRARWGTGGGAPAPREAKARVSRRRARSWRRSKRRLNFIVYRNCLERRFPASRLQSRLSCRSQSWMCDASSLSCRRRCGGRRPRIPAGPVSRLRASLAAAICGRGAAEESRSCGRPRHPQSSNHTRVRLSRATPQRSASASTR